MSLFKSETPRPTPKFFVERETFSTKKERCTPRNDPPPRPPGKSCPPVSRIFSDRPQKRAQLVSFKESDSSLQSKCYDADSNLPYFDQCFEVICKLGSGSFADVYKVRSKEDGQYYAIKRSKEKFRGKFDRQRKLEEVQKHEQLPKHRNCIRFYKAWEEKKYLYIQTELCRTSLSQCAEGDHSISESTIWNYLVDLLLALKHLHDHDFVHLDVKPDNIFISEEGICKLGDFGLVIDVSKGPVSEAIEGDPRYLAPEVMEGKFTKAADVFSLGITILELACDLVLPTSGNLWHQLRKGDIPQDDYSHVSAELFKVICLMMEPDPSKRLTADEILEIKTVSEVLRQRKMLLRAKSLVSYFMLLYKVILSCLCCVKTAMVYSYSYFIAKEKPVTPARTLRSHPPEWDFSFSDDDVFEDDHNLAAPLSKSLDERSSSFSWLTKRPSIPGRLDSSPSTINCLLGKNIFGPDSSGSPDLKWKSGNPYMSSSPKSSKKNPHSSRRENELKAANLMCIAPKNLMEAFDAETDDD